MNIKNTINLLQKYKKLSNDLGLSEDSVQFDSLINFFTNFYYSEDISFSDTQQLFKKKNGEKEFEEITSQECFSLDKYGVNENIITNKDNIAGYWNTIDAKERENFSIFELNLMLYLISKQYNKYMKKDKRRIISFLSEVVKAQNLDNAYKEIQV